MPREDGINDTTTSDTSMWRWQRAPASAWRESQLGYLVGKYEKDAAARGLKFVPLIFETCGFVAEPAVKLI
jgi:hypothetical protein